MSIRQRLQLRLSESVLCRWYGILCDGLSRYSKWQKAHYYDPWANDQDWAFVLCSEMGRLICKHKCVIIPIIAKRFNLRKIGVKNMTTREEALAFGLSYPDTCQMHRFMILIGS